MFVNFSAFLRSLNVSALLRVPEVEWSPMLNSKLDLYSPTWYPLAQAEEYSQHLASYWSHQEYILSIWPSIGATCHVNNNVEWSPMLNSKLVLYSPTWYPLAQAEVYSQHLASYWSHQKYILNIWHPIGHIRSIFSASGILLVTSEVYSQHLASYWCHVSGEQQRRVVADVELKVGLVQPHLVSIGPGGSIFSASGILLVTSEVYSQHLASYWRHVSGEQQRRVVADVELKVGLVQPHLVSIGPGGSIFSASGILLVTSEVYSQHLASYRSHQKYILNIWHPIGHIRSIFSASGLLLVPRVR
jgi:hypothetical protein